MADKEDKAKAPAKENKKENKKYYRNKLYAGETILLGFKDPNDSTTAIKESFSKYAFRVRGDDVLEGYLETVNPKVIDRLAGLDHVEELSETEYNKSIKDGRRIA